MRRLGAAASPAYPILGLLLAGGLVLRLMNNDHGLPFVYSEDEGRHFTKRAIDIFAEDDWNPGYFQNPSGFTYLVHLLVRFRYGPVWPFGDFDVTVRQFSIDPTSVYVLARSLAAVICMVGVLAVFFVGRRLWGAREGLVAAAILAFAFLPVAYSRLAVTDVGTLAPVALAVYAAVRIHQGGGRRYYVIAGAAIGLAIGFKYTAGLVAIPVLVAAVLRLRRNREAALDCGVALVAGLVAFFVTTPYFFLDFDTARRQIEAQAETAGDFEKLGQEESSGFGYYLRSLGWGLGWAAGLAALAGAVLEVRRERLRGLLLLLFPIALFVYLSLQARYFGRWLLPAYPVLALLGAVALVGLADAARGLPLVRRGPLARAALLALLTLIVLAQPIAADVRTARVLGREDTRQTARDFLVNRLPQRARVVIEPVVPKRYYLAARPGSTRVTRVRQFIGGFIRDVEVTHIDYAATLRPETIDEYRRNGYCVVMTTSLHRGRADNAEVSRALAYYERLERESELIFSVDPYRDGKGPVKFDFDLSYNYYPTAFERPGPEVRIYRLRDCRQGFGPTAKGVGTPDVQP